MFEQAKMQGLIDQAEANLAREKDNVAVRAQGLPRVRNTFHQADIFDLRTKCEPVDFEKHSADTLKSIADTMIAVCNNGVIDHEDMIRKGIGLAGNQIGIFMRVIVIQERTGVFTAMFNPEILKTSKRKVATYEEGCLSVLDVHQVIKRYKEVKVGYYDHTGTYIKRKYRGIQAVCVQHEVEHLDGILIADYVGKK